MSLLWPRTGPATSSPVAGPARVRGRHATRYAREVLARRQSAESEFRNLWRLVAEGVGLARVVHVAAGVTVVAPKVGGVRLDGHGRVTSATVQRHPGQTVADYRKLASLLADALDVAHVRVDDLGADRWVRLHLLDVDPVGGVRHWVSDLPDGYVATAEDGTALTARWQRRPHVAVQGATGSGKSSLLYVQLAALADRDDVRVCGVDPTGLIWKPWPHDPWRVSGLRDLDEVRRVLRELVAELDARLASMPADTDNLVTTRDTPCLAVVFDEYPGLIRAAEVAGKQVVAEVRGYVSRLLSEGRKAGIRVVLVMQRAEASTADATVRAQCGLRLSFSVDSPEAFKFLHPADSADVAEHATAPPGVAILTGPGVGTVRVRTPLLAFADYCAVVRRASPGCGVSRPTSPGSGLDPARVRAGRRHDEGPRC